MAVCTRCGTENPPGAKFCKNCREPQMAAGVGGGLPPVAPFVAVPAIPGGGYVAAAPTVPAPGLGHVPAAPTRPDGPAFPGLPAPGFHAAPTQVEGGFGRAAAGQTVLEEEETRKVLGFLVVMKGPGAPPYADFPIHDGRNVIGRPGPEVGIALADPEVSTQHAAIVCNGGAFTLMDLASSNGTYVDGRRERIVHSPLVHGTRVKVGRTTLVFVPVPGVGGESLA